MKSYTISIGADGFGYRPSEDGAGKTVLGYPACDARDMLKQWVAQRKRV